MIVMKFGGTSVGTAESIRTACRLVKDRLPRRPVVVVSAHNSPSCRMTDTLIDCAQQALRGKPDAKRVFDLQRGVCRDLGLDTALVDAQLEEFANLLSGIHMIGEISPRTMDLVMSFGERMSSRVFAEVLAKEFGVETRWETAYNLGLLTDGNFGSAKPDKKCFPRLGENVAGLGGEAVVTTGFLGASPDGHITTLGRGGSDFSATIFGAAVRAEEVEIWTDVDGVMSADPKLVPGAKSIPELSFMEASELAWYGAKVLHPSTMIPAIEHRIPVRVLNTHRPEHPGTVILPQLSDSGAGAAKSIASQKHTDLVTITSARMLGSHGFMARVFEVFGRHQVDIHMIATSEVSISLTTPRGERLTEAANELREFAEVTIEQDKALISVVGENMAGVPGVASRVCGALAKAGVNIRMISQGARELNIALLVDGSDMVKAVQALHGELF